MKKVKNEEELREILNSNDVTVVKWSATWCGPCKVLGNIINEIDSEPIDTAEFVEIDIEEADEDFVEKANIRNVPVLEFYVGNTQVERSVGLITKQALIEKINSYKPV